MKTRFFLVDRQGAESQPRLLFASFSTNNSIFILLFVIPHFESLCQKPLMIKNDGDTWLRHFLSALGQLQGVQMKSRKGRSKATQRDGKSLI